MAPHKKRLSVKDLARRVTGFSTPFGGISWKASASERDEVRALLKDRRALFNPYDLEVESQVDQSVDTIRSLCTEAIAALPDESPGVGHIRAIRAACRRFLDSDWQRNRFSMHHGRPGSAFLVALGELRAAVGVQVAALALHYKIELEDELASIIPPEDTDGTK